MFGIRQDFSHKNRASAADQSVITLSYFVHGIESLQRQLNWSHQTFADADLTKFKIIAEVDISATECLS